MIKVLLVDDEPLCLIGMQSMIDWSDLGFKIVATARNGAEAWNIISLQQPDIVITDLAMPVMGGLELAEKCREADRALPVFIILTNYEEVDYIKRSLRLGAVEYLIKIDLTAEELTAALTKAKAQIDKERFLRSAPDVRTAEERLEQYRELLLMRLYSGAYDTYEEFSAQCRELGFKFDSPYYIITCAVIEERSEETKDMALLHSGVTGMAAEILPKYLSGVYVSGIDLRHFAVLTPLDTLEGSDEILQNAFMQTGNILFRYFNAAVQWAVGIPVKDILLVKDSLNAAMSMLTQVETDRTVRVLFCRTTPQSALDYRAGLVTRIREYVSNNLSKRLTLNDVAAVFSFSPNYISQLFSREGESGFVEFVTETRINSAKELMATTTLKIYEISDLVGFESPSYFSKVFKKTEGISPREYIQRLTE